MELENDRLHTMVLESEHRIAALHEQQEREMTDARQWFEKRA